MGEKPLYYRYQRTGNAIPRTRKRGGKEQHYLEPEIQKVFFEEEYVKNFSLDRYGLPIHSKIANYTTVENYLLDFWSPIMGGEAVFTFILLIRHCYGYDADGMKKDFSFPELETLAEKWGKTIPTVKKYLDILEDHYFIYRFWRSNPNNHHTDDSILYKLRTSIPYLSEEQVMKLSPKLQVQHDKFLRKIAGKYNENVELTGKYDFSQEFSEIMKSGSVQAPKPISPEEIDKYHEIREAQLRSRIKDTDRQSWEWILEFVRNKISPPSFKTWFEPNFCVIEDGILHLYVPTPFVADWIRNRYIPVIKEAYQSIHSKAVDIVIHIVRDRESKS